MHSGWSTTMETGFSSPSESPCGPSEAYTTVIDPPLRVPSSHGRPTPSIASGPLEGFCLSPSSPSEGLQSIGGLELVDNHSSHQESNEAGPLALIQELNKKLVIGSNEPDRQILNSADETRLKALLQFVNMFRN
ncbi:hypothetical protein U9M48_008905 [Paspalum notatum var. saurae]|uniref:Uncharacterized protein n=1 Tax=Paspalum notatum var. saurae TaxID=547442 RepID=A0AAQ3WE62_PASNO